MKEIVYPKKLKKWDKIMVVAPARSSKILSQETVDRAIERLEALGLHVVLWKNIAECDQFLTSSVESRIEDLHNAFRDPSISWIFSVVGWFSTNQILDYIDYDLIRQNPKIVCWFSDITVLHNAILAKTWIVGYYWPHFSSWGIKYGFDYSIEYFKKCCMEDRSFDINDSLEWSDDERYLDQEKRVFEKNEWSIILQEGDCYWRIIGWNIECFCVLMWTPYLPKIQEDIILFIEQDSEWNAPRFIRRLEQILQSEYSKYIKWIVIGKFQKENNVSIDQLKIIISNQKKIKWIPIIANVNFGHVMPIATFPIWWLWFLSAHNNKFKISILEH